MKRMTLSIVCNLVHEIRVRRLIEVIGSILAGTTSKSRLCRLLTTTPPLPSATAAMVVVSSIYLEYFGPRFTIEALAGDDFLWKPYLHAWLA